ncbi:hypothetical protein [Clostridium sp. 1001271B_151109_B4]|uniref:hypothetical protein n=1 Tax=Clostridium sp. 1001271B_151109_B4 TaxID=2787148 RepID=UPI0018AC0DB2|nr:hypothetical protein [Clostridium sp. 1001271B_151109_B4]
MKEKLGIIDKAIMGYFLFQILFLRWMTGVSYFSYMGIIIIIFVLVRKKRKFRLTLLDILISYIYIFIVGLNIFFNGTHELLFNNLYSEGIVNLIAIIYILVLRYENPKGLKNYILNEVFYILNIYFIVNIPIIIKQLEGTYFFMRLTQFNPMYEDHITGLIGASGTHELTFYWIILVLINFYKFSQNRKKMIIVITTLYIIFMFIISSQNDNTAFFIIFPLIMVQYCLKFVLDKKYIIKNLIKSLFIILIIIGVSVFIYNSNEDVNIFVNTRVLSKLEQFGIKDRNVTNQGSDEERIALFKVALEKGDGYKIGKGIGSIQTYGEPTLPKHFGMSEISLRTYEGGLVYLIILILIFSHFLYRIYRPINKDKLIVYIAITLDITFFAIYTLIFRQVFFSFALALIVFIFSLNYKEE